MNTITQTMRFRQALINYSYKYGAAIHYKTNRQYVYRWRKRYDGTLQSLADKSHRPHHHPETLAFSRFLLALAGKIDALRAVVALFVKRL